MLHDLLIFVAEINCVGFSLDIFCFNFIKCIGKNAREMIDSFIGLM